MVVGLKRNGKSCRLRWMNYLSPNVKRESFSEEEEDLIIRLHTLLGNRSQLTITIIIIVLLLLLLIRNYQLMQCNLQYYQFSYSPITVWLQCIRMLFDNIIIIIFFIWYCCCSYKWLTCHLKHMVILASLPLLNFLTFVTFSCMSWAAPT